MDELDDPASIRLDALISMVTGATAYMNPRWRSLLDGPLFSAFGWYADDGSRTAKSEEIKRLAQWSKQSDVLALWKMKPVRGDVALVLVDESQDWCYAMQGDTNVYAACVRGMHRGLTAAGLSCDFAKPDAAQLREHRVAYVPFPVAMTAATLDTLITWAKAGGHLVLEACAGYFDEQAHAFPHQPNRALGELFGSVVEHSSFALDQHDGLTIQTASGDLPCAIYRQNFKPQASHEILGHFADGRAAIIRGKTGKDSVTLVGSNPSYGMQKQVTPGSLAWLRSTLQIQDPPPCSNAECIVRSFHGESSLVIWVINPTKQELAMSIAVSAEPKVLRGKLMDYNAKTNTARVTIPSYDAVILRLPA